MEDYPEDAETLALFGRVEKDAWFAAWRGPNKTQEEMIKDASYEEGLLVESIKAYIQGIFSGPKALLLGNQCS